MPGLIGEECPHAEFLPLVGQDVAGEACIEDVPAVKLRRERFPFIQSREQSVRLGLLSSKTATMSTARKLTDRLSEFFPDDPLKGDFALFGYGINSAMANDNLIIYTQLLP